jgi:DNA-binding IclR family transcriptional regulator
LTFEPTHPLRFLARVGDSVRSLYATSAGKALLASLGDEELAAVLASAKLEALTPNTLISPAALRADIRAGSRRGWHLNREESQEGVTTLSASFIWTSTVYIVTIAGPAARLEPKLATASALLVDVCAQLASPV